MGIKQGIREENACIGDIKRKFIRHPDRQKQVRISAADAAGAASLGFWRGRQQGRYDACKFLKKRFPEATKMLAEKWGMDDRGDIVL